MKRTSMALLLFFGVMFLVPVVFGAQIFLKPQYATLNYDWTNYSCLSGMYESECVDTQSDSSYLYTGSESAFETFAFENLPAETSAVTYVRLWYYAKRYSLYNYYFGPIICYNPPGTGCGMWGSQFSTTSTYSWYSATYTENPTTGNRWTVSEVNNLRAGMNTNNQSYQGANVDYMDIEVVYST